jgi:amyloid beta precursor protein binding protein 1
MDDQLVSEQDAGNNFFFNGYQSIGKNRAQEAVKYLSELNDSVEGVADTSNFNQRFQADPSFLTSFTLVCP